MITSLTWMMESGFFCETCFDIICHIDYGCESSVIVMFLILFNSILNMLCNQMTVNS